jgi:heterodisulfide reductase subunit A-like polyferredoxin
LANEHMHSMGAHDDDEEKKEDEKEALQEGACPKCGQSPCVCPSINESVNLKGLTKEQLTETIKEIIRKKLLK